MLSPHAQIFTVEDADYVDERERRRVTIYRCLNTLQSIFDSESELNFIDDYRKKKVDEYIDSIRAINLLIDIFPPEVENESN